MHGDVSAGDGPGRDGGPHVGVTVVVAVHNPGNAIDELLVSLDRQSMHPEEFEVIFVDDDSTDGTRERLAGWAESRPNVRVLHNTLNSGWPGRPRNLAIDAAAGEFLFFADNDDKFAPRGLEQMYDFATTCEADVLVAKETGVGPGRTINRQVFRENITDAKLGRDPILGLLTPHKLVRTSMVREHGIRFPEGRVRLEDHYFVMSCYFAARRISVLADHACYYWMRRVSEGKNASASVYDPVIYFRAVERTLEVVEANTEPGPLRDQLYAHWYEKKMVSALRGQTFLRKTTQHQDEVFRELRRLSARFGLGEAQWPWMGALGRINSHFLMNDALDQVRAFGAVARGVTSQVTVEEVSVSDEHQLRLRLRGRLVYAGGTPVGTTREGAALYWDTSVFDTDFELPRIEVTDLVDAVELDVVLRDRATGAINVAQSHHETVEETGFEVRSEVDIDLRTLAVHHPHGAVVDLSTWLKGAGWVSERRIHVSALTLPEERPVGELLVHPYATERYGNLSLHLHRPKPVPAPQAESQPKPQTSQKVQKAPSRPLPEQPTARYLARESAALLKRRARSVLGALARRVRQR